MLSSPKVKAHEFEHGMRMMKRQQNRWIERKWVDWKLEGLWKTVELVYTTSLVTRPYLYGGLFDQLLIKDACVLSDWDRTGC